MEGAKEVLLITGRGNNSIDSYSPVRESIVKLLPSLRRRNVIATYLEHTAGSFVITFAPVNALFEAPKRRRERSPAADKSVPVSLTALEKETVRQLRDLAVLTLGALGVHAPTPKTLRDEMEHQFASLAAAIPKGHDQEAVLQQAIQRAAERVRAVTAFTIELPVADARSDRGCSHTVFPEVSMAIAVRRIPHALPALFTVGLTVSCASSMAVHAQTSASASASMVGYSPASAKDERRIEALAIAGPEGTRAREHSRALSKEPHIAGTPAQEHTRDYVIAQMKAMGIETEARSYDVWLPHATGVRVWRMGRDTMELKLAEPPIAGDAVTSLPPYLTVNGSSGAGSAEGEMVFVNYGLIEDYATLDSLGVSVKGKVVLARYGRSFRGIKSREAQKRGAVALLIYTDPADDGYTRGEVYPDGPMRPVEGVQRGSVYNGTGDPLTPGYASKPGAPRLRPDQTDLPKIPVVPISSANATLLMQQMRGTVIPSSWQGGMGLRYHIGAGPVRVKVEVKTDEATAGTKAIWDTFGTIRGSEFPDEYVYIGGHRDGWGPGAADNVSGIVSVLESAKAVSQLLAGGWRPKRTIVFATWDAEEWGMVGSTEYVEDDSLKLMKGAVAYFNQDVAAQGPSFGRKRHSVAAPRAARCAQVCARSARQDRVRLVACWQWREGFVTATNG